MSVFPRELIIFNRLWAHYCVLLCSLLTVFFYNFLMAFVRLSLNSSFVIIVT